jgi:predicted SnoaL-like aldol condensation-catalyzing enzyme
MIVPDQLSEVVMVYLDKEAITQLIEAFNQRNLEPGSKLFAEDVILHCPGKSRISGEYQGNAGVVKFWQKQIMLTKETFQAEVVAVSQGEGTLMLVIEISVNKDGQIFSWRRVNHYKVVEGRVVEGWIYEGDQYTADAVFA